MTAWPRVHTTEQRHHTQLLLSVNYRTSASSSRTRPEVWSSIPIALPNSPNACHPALSLYGHANECAISAWKSVVYKCEYVCFNESVFMHMCYNAMFSTTRQTHFCIAFTPARDVLILSTVCEKERICRRRKRSIQQMMYYCGDDWDCCSAVASKAT